jgi:hypothetical protein
VADTVEKLGCRRLRAVTPSLMRKALRSGGGHGEHRHWDQLCELTQVLSSSCKVELVAGTARPSQSQSIQPQNAFEVSEQHLDLFALASRCKPFVLFRDGAGKIAGALLDERGTLRRCKAPPVLRSP